MGRSAFPVYPSFIPVWRELCSHDALKHQSFLERVKRQQPSDVAICAADLGCERLYWLACLYLGHPEMCSLEGGDQRAVDGAMSIAGYGLDLDARVASDLPLLPRSARWKQSSACHARTFEYGLVSIGRPSHPGNFPSK